MADEKHLKEMETRVCMASLVNDPRWERLLNAMLGPIRFESNRPAVLSVLCVLWARGVKDDKAIRFCRILGNHCLTQPRIDLSMKLN